MNQISWKTQAVACILFITHVLSQCSTSNPCAEGCCSVGGGYCGYGPEFCASSVCNAAASADGTCAQKSQCDPGVYPGYGSTWGMHFLSPNITHAKKTRRKKKTLLTLF